MAPKKKDDKKAGKADAKGGKATGPSIPPGEKPEVQWAFLFLTIGLIALSVFTSFKCFVQWRKTSPLRADLHVMKKIVSEQYENLRHSPINVILEAVKEDVEELIARQSAITRAEFGIKEVVALFRNDWIQGQGGLFHFSAYPFTRQECFSNCEKFNATVVFIDDSKKETFLENFLSGSKLGCFWLPVILSANSLWYKIDEQVLNIAFWGATAIPNSRCACLTGGCTTTHRCWAKIPCNTQQRCMCEKKPESSQSFH